MRVAVAQIPMAASIADNVASIGAATRTAASVGADLAVFPECTITGFHRGLPALFDPAALAEAVEAVHAVAREARFFTPGRRRRLTLGGRSVGVVVCREILDPVADELQGVDLVLWPGYVAWDAGTGDDCLGAASALAKRLGVPIVQANWPDSLNAPETRGLGGSVVLGGDGEILARAAADRAETSVVTLRP